MFIYCTNNEILERHREMVCPVYAAKEKERFQRKVPLEEGTKPMRDGLELDDLQFP